MRNVPYACCGCRARAPAHASAPRRRRSDGVFQLYLELPYLHYLEIDSLVYDEKKTGLAARGWDRVASRKFSVAPLGLVGDESLATSC